MDRRTPENYRSIIASLEAENDRLREQVEILNHALRNTQDSLIAAGNRAYSAEAKVARLRAALDTAFNEGYRLSNNLHVAEAENARLRDTMTIDIVRSQAAAIEQLRTVLVLARQYVVKGVIEDAYADCVTSGDTVLRRIDAVLDGDGDKE